MTLFAGDGDTFRTIRVKTIRVGCQVVPDVIAIVLNAKVIGLPALRHSGRFTIDGYREQLIFNDDPIHPVAPVPTESSAASPTAAPTGARASMLIASADDPQNPVVSLGSTVWTLIPAASGQPATVAVEAEADIPDLKMHATMTLRKNTDPTLQATHTIDLKFSFTEGAPIAGFKDVGLPQMRKEDSTAAEALASVKVKISDVYFLIALAKGDSGTRNLDLMQTRAWFDFPLLLNDDRIAKIVFQKSPEAEAMLDKAFDAWKSETPAPPAEARVAQALPTVEDLPQYKFAREIEHSPVTGGSAESRYLTTVYGMIRAHMHESADSSTSTSPTGTASWISMLTRVANLHRPASSSPSSGSPNLDSAVMTSNSAAAPYPAPLNRSPISLNYNFGKSAQLNTDTSATAAPTPTVPPVPPPAAAVGQPATAPASAEATAPATTTDRFSKIGVADDTLVIGHFASANPDCTSSGKTFVRISHPPSHGVVNMRESMGFSYFAKTPECNSRKIQGVTIEYVPNRGFTGSDELELDVIYPSGHEHLNTYSITIK